MRFAIRFPPRKGVSANVSRAAGTAGRPLPGAAWFFALKPNAHPAKGRERSERAARPLLGAIPKRWLSDRGISRGVRLGDEVTDRGCRAC